MASAVDELAAGIKHVEELIGEDVLEPDLARTDWAEMKARVRLLHDGIETDVLGRVDAAIAEVEEDEFRYAAERRIAALVAAAAVPIYAVGDVRAFAKLLARAAEIAPEPDLEQALRAGIDEATTFCRLEHARWLDRKGRTKDADKVAKQVARSATHPALRAAAKKLLAAPKPIKSAPALFRLNGCGFGLYGARDHQPGGWYVATYCICILFIPVLPLAAYRVRQSGGNTYQFIARERLGPIARAWLMLVLGGAACAIAWSGFSGWRDSPERKARIALEQAQAVEASGNREAALERYHEVVRAHMGAIDLGPAAEAIVRLSAAAVAEPCTPASAEPIGRVVAGYYDLPESVRAGSATRLLSQRMVAWADQIGEADVDRSRATLTVLDTASGVAVGTAEQQAVEQRRGRVRRTLADRLAPDRPLAALALYVELPDDEARGKALAILDGFGEPPSLWIEAAPSVDAWVKTAGTARAADGSRIAKRLEAARAEQAVDATLVNGADEKRLAKALADRAGHQEIATALAGKQRARGDLAGALATLTALGPPGRLTADAQQLLAWVHADRGDLPRADAILTSFLDERLPAFQRAQRAYSAAAKAAQDRIMASAKAGVIGSDLERQMQGAAEKDRPELFRAWMSEQMAVDPTLGSARAEFLRHEAVVPASLGLGMLKLRRVGDAVGEDRKRLLAEAERVFLSIRQEAEGEPGFHLGLGQVYHRLGRTADAEAELKRVLDRGIPELTYSVAQTYRDLALIPRARQTAQALFDSAAEPEWKARAALLMAHMGTDLQEREGWLKKSDTNLAAVKEMLAEVAAQRLMQSGKLAEADRAYASLAETREREVKHDASAANNTALAYLGRYGATGDLAHMRSALKHLEAAVRLAPESAIVAGNLSDALRHAGLVAVLEKWFDNRALALDGREAESLVGVLLEGPLRDEAVEALRQDPSLRRSLEVTRGEQVLAPQKTASYHRQLDWLEWTRDEAALGDLSKRLGALPPFDAEGLATERKKWESGERDTEMEKEIAESVRRAQDRLQQVQRTGKKPTVAAAWFLLGQALAIKAYFAMTPETIEAMVDAPRKAAEIWPEGGMGLALPSALSSGAFFRAALRSPAVARIWKAEGRLHGFSMVVLRAAKGPDGAEVLAALRAEPELAEAVRLRKASPAGRPLVSDWMLGRIAGDAELEQAGAAAFKRKELELAAKIDAQLAPGQPREAAVVELFEQASK